MLLTLAWACGLRMKWAWVRPMHLDVIDISAAAGDETLVFLAHDACADAFNAHDMGLPAGAAFVSRGFHQSTRLATSFSSSRCGSLGRLTATFMRPAASRTDLTML
jgi:hypothetical protein